MSFECIWCEDWKANIKELNAPNQLLFARNPETFLGYQGKTFKFCPWCGEGLHQVETKEPKMSLESAFAVSMLVVVAIGLSTFLHRPRKRRGAPWLGPHQDEIDRHTEKLWRARIERNRKSAAAEDAMNRWHADPRSDGTRRPASVTHLRTRRTRSPSL